MAAKPVRHDFLLKKFETFKKQHKGSDGLALLEIETLYSPTEKFFSNNFASREIETLLGSPTNKKRFPRIFIEKLERAKKKALFTFMDETLPLYTI